MLCNMSEQPILVEARAGYRVITLNRPDRLNAFNEAMHVALRAALDDAQADESCRALMITGAGRGFCAGQDLSDRLAKPGETVVLGATQEAYYNPLVRQLACAAVSGGRRRQRRRRRRRLQPRARLRHRDCRPVGELRAVLRPHRPGAGFRRHLDFCRAWSATPARAGWRCWRRTWTADKAASWGLIWKCVDDNVLMSEAGRICEHFAAAPTQGLALIKRALNASAGNTLDAQLDLERDLQRAASLTPDYAEGVRAFMEKRKPNFTGRKGS